jgi:drug/metabolite transporter (DMT)-like permease
MQRAPLLSAPARPASTLGWYALLVLSWSGAWYAMKLQAALAPASLSVALRFGLAGLLMVGWCVGRQASLRFDRRMHALFMLIGALMFSVNFLFAYNAARFLTSALVAVVFSLASVLNLALAALLFGERMTARAVLGGLCGSAGLALMLWTQVAVGGAGSQPWLGLLLAAGMTLCFCLGSMASTVAQRRGLAIAPVIAWSMLWGAAFSALHTVSTGQPLHVELSAVYLGSLGFLVIFGSVLGFIAYFTLVARLGASQAAYAMVMSPIGALLISTVFEHYRWTLLSLAGVLVSVFGNVIVLRARRVPPPPVRPVHSPIARLHP